MNENFLFFTFVSVFTYLIMEEEFSNDLLLPTNTELEEAITVTGVLEDLFEVVLGFL